MKTKILLSLFSVVIFSSCIKDYHGNIDSKDSILTETNYIFSEDIKAKSLDFHIAMLEAEIKDLKMVLDLGQATNAQKERYVEATLEKDTALNEQRLILGYLDEVYKKGPKPLPPCPRPRNCNDFWEGLEIVTLPVNYETFRIEIYDKNNNVIARTEGYPKPLNDFEGYLNYIHLKFNTADYKGQILVKASGETKDGAFEPFSIESYIN
ncbi:hypothetical protein [Maribacter hydrothermalis]|uniref:Uncharacterized protein n=1 Tax=Maribacter hydrothermalis TaxID=1836467 RepID=A0A1B7ZEW2_9FLAO|nr:hypothetical protein [Maribacter hydrothermalis]APQ17599.1 hypothetical protein BTR34_09775 [Maribacter hydrothermalis]OBR42074.1 hypothetical protein A9200_01405 [Maribacter hydrothermalis]